MPQPSSPLSLTIPSDLRMLPVARAFVEAVGEAAGLDPSTIYTLVLVTGEAVSNVIRHAHRDRPEAHLQLQCQICPDRFEITLLDEGEPFDLDRVPDLDPGELRIGGRGVFLMRTLLDELISQPRGERGNTLRMVKRCQLQAAGR